MSFQMSPSLNVRSRQQIYVSFLAVWFGDEEKEKTWSCSWKANRLSAQRWCLFASLCDLWAEEVNGSELLIVLWSRHGALAPRRVRLTKVKSAGSIKAHLRVAEPPAWLQGCGRAWVRRASSTLDTFSQPQIIINKSLTNHGTRTVMMIWINVWNWFGLSQAFCFSELCHKW